MIKVRTEGVREGGRVIEKSRGGRTSVYAFDVIFADFCVNR